MNIRKKLALLGILGLSAASLAHADGFDPETQVTTISTFVSGALTTLVTAILTLSVGVFMVKMAMRFANKSKG